MPQQLMIASAMVFIVGGLGHLTLTFVGNLLRPRDPSLEARRHLPAHDDAARRIGFNASHSTSLLLFAALYGYLAAAQPALLFGSSFLMAIGFAFLVAYLGLALRYWFVGAVVSTGTALALYAAAVVLAHA